MLMNYLYGGSSKSTTRAEEASVVVVESPGMQGPDGDLVHTSHATELKDAANGSTDKTRLQASSVVIDGNPSVGGALQLVATPTTGYSRSSNVAFPLVIGENIEGTMVPRSTATFQASLQTKLPMDMKTPQPPVSQISFPTVSKKQELAGARAKDVLVIKTPERTTNQIHQELVLDIAEEEAELLRLWTRVRDTILAEDYSSAGPSSSPELASASLGVSPCSSSAPTALSSTTSARPCTPSETPAVHIVQPSQLRACFSTPLLSTSPKCGRFVEVLDSERVSVVPWGDFPNGVPKRLPKRSMSGLLSRWRRDSKVRS